MTKQPDGSTLLPQSFDPSDKDVICGWARQNHHHSGNQRFRDVINDFAPRYASASTKLEKTGVIAAVIDKIRVDSPDGGFVKRDYQSGRWYEIGDEKARDKVGHAIRKASEEISQKDGECSTGSSRANKERRRNSTSSASGESNTTTRKKPSCATSPSGSQATVKPRRPLQQEEEEVRTERSELGTAPATPPSSATSARRGGRYEEKHESSRQQEDQDQTPTTTMSEISQHQQGAASSEDDLRNTLLSSAISQSFQRQPPALAATNFPHTTAVLNALRQVAREGEDSPLLQSHDIVSSTQQSLLHHALSSLSTTAPPALQDAHPQTSQLLLQWQRTLAAMEALGGGSPPSLFSQQLASNQLFRRDLFGTFPATTLPPNLMPATISSNPLLALNVGEGTRFGGATASLPQQQQRGQPGVGDLQDQWGRTFGAGGSRAMAAAGLLGNNNEGQTLLLEASQGAAMSRTSILPSSIYPPVAFDQGRSQSPSLAQERGSVTSTTTTTRQNSPIRGRGRKRPQASREQLEPEFSSSGAGTFAKGGGSKEVHKEGDLESTKNDQDREMGIEGQGAVVLDEDKLGTKTHGDQGAGMAETNKK